MKPIKVLPKLWRISGALLKLKQKEVPEYREQLLQDQKGVCPLCRQEIRQEEAALDHDHTSGHVRAVLHRDCNVLLGYVENFLKGRGKRLSTSGGIYDFMGNIFRYMEANYDLMPLHYKHKTEADKLKSLYRRKIKQVKKEETKEKYRQMIRGLG